MIRRHYTPAGRLHATGPAEPNRFSRVIRATPEDFMAQQAHGKEIANGKPFLTDVKTLRARAREHLEGGALGTNYIGNAKKTVEILQTVLATEIVCVLRYTMHAVTASGLASDSVRAEFAEHAREEQDHMMLVAERINQLGGKPDFNPEGLASRSASQYAEGANLVDMIRENLVAERIAVDHYRELIRYFGNDDPGTKSMLQEILRKEEEHADDMHDLLVAHEGTPMLKS